MRALITPTFLPLSSYSLAMRTLRSLAFTSLVALLTIASSATAQTSTTSGAVRGRISSDENASMSGVAVTAVNQETGFTRSARSDAQGVYTVALLPPGTYRVSARRIGLQQSEQGNVRVVVGASTTTNFTLRSAAVALAAVEVRAEATQIDVADGGVKQTVSQEEIANLPALGRDFTDFINLSGLVSPTPEVTTGGQFSIAGQRPSQTNVQIDGVDANQSFFGENRGGSRIPFAFSLESIREFQVITNGFDVEYGNYSGGVVNIVTKGGTNTFKGTVYGNLRDESLTAKDFNGNTPNKFSVQQYAAQVEGPFIKDKLHYLFSLDGQRRREPFRTITPEFLRSTTNPAFARSDSMLADSLERFFDILETQYGGDRSTFSEFQITNDVLTLFGRLDWTLNDKHRVSLRNNFSDYENKDEAGGFAFRAGRSQAETIEDRANSVVGEITSALRPNLFNVFRAQYASEFRPRTPNSYLPELNVRLTPTAEPVEYGGSLISFNNSIDEKKVQLIDNLTWSAGAHTFKLGTNNTFSRFQNFFVFNGSGGFEFRSLADFEARRPSRYNRNVRIDGKPPNATFSTAEYSAYVQDDWQITPKLLASLGIRYDNSRYSDQPGRVVDVERAFGLKTGIAPIDDDNFSPRVSLTYDVNGDARQILRGGAALFYGRVPFVLGGNVAITEVPQLVLDCRGSIADNAPDAPPIPDFRNLNPNGSDNPFNCAGAGGIGGTPEYAFWTDAFELPETFKANVGYERVLGPNTRIAVDLLFSETGKLYTVRNINLRESQFELTNEGGRRIFVPATRFSPSSAAGTDRLRNTTFSNVFVNYNDGTARSAIASVEVNHKVSARTSLRGSYTFTRAEDNSSFSCCTSNAGFGDQRYGALGPNDIGGVGDRSAGWGPSNFERNHTVVLSGFFTLPFDVRVSSIFRMQSGTPWGPEVRGDLNGDGVSFNDRPYVFRPEDLPIAVPASAATQVDSLAFIAEQRLRYAKYLQKFDCIGDFQGEIIERNSCRQPWFNRLDVSVRKRIDVGRQGAELSVDLFNVLNGLNKKWGKYEAVTAANRNLLLAQQFRNGKVEYTVPTTLGTTTQVGNNLQLQFSAQVGARLFF